MHSVQGQGTTFRVFLPASTQAAPAQAGERGGAVRSKFRGKGQRIVLVEDEVGVAKFVSEALRQNGYVVTAATSLREARGIFAEREGDFEMIFSDAVLPDGNGIELLEELLTSHPEIKGILSSGYTDKHNVNEILRQRSIEFLQKPYSLPILVSTVGEMMGKIEVLTA